MNNNILIYLGSQDRINAIAKSEADNGKVTVINGADLGSKYESCAVVVADIDSVFDTDERRNRSDVFIAVYGSYNEPYAMHIEHVNNVSKYSESAWIIDDPNCKDDARYGYKPSEQLQAAIDLYYKVSERI